MTPDEFRKIRKAARLTQAEMAERLGKSRKTIVNWETGIFPIPPDALDTLTERGVAPTPAKAKPVGPGTHPELYGPGQLPNSFSRNEKHPHWFATCSMLHYHMQDAQVEAVRGIVTMPEDIEKLQWTPERAVAFIMQFDRRNERSTRMSRARAEEIARSVGFDLPAPTESAFNIAHNDWLARYGSLKGFYEAYPQFTPPPVEQTLEQIENSRELRAALDAAFNLTKNPGE